MSDSTTTGWHFSADTLRDGSPRPGRGVALRHRGEVIPCQSGYHQSERAIDALYYAPGSWVARVVGTGAVAHGNPVDKYACRTRTALTGHQYRLWQARQLIRVRVTLIPQASEEPVRVYVSMMDDRYRDGGGYRSLVTVMSDADTRRQLLSEALEYLQEARRRYGHLKELAGVFAAVDEVG